jgi:6-phosphogluconolactonase
MLRLGLPLLILFALGCRNQNEETPPGIPFYLGTYTDGGSEGIYKYLLSPDGSLQALGLMARAENPSFLAFSTDGRYLLAVNEVSNENKEGYVSSFEIGTDTLMRLDQKSSGGAHPCHVVTRQDGYVVVANYTGGNMGLLKIEEDGGLSELLDVQQHLGSGSHERQEGPHAHSGWFMPDGSVISVDLGTNQFWFSEIIPDSSKFQPLDPQTLTLEAGAGPRHLSMHPRNPWIYVVNELSSSVSLIKRDGENASLRVVQTLTTLPGDFTGENTCADIHVSPDGKYLYASNRGHNSLAIFSIDPDSGRLTVAGHEATRGETPRNFSLSPDGQFLLVANQNTNNIVSFRRDEANGSLSYVEQIEAPTPVCILFANLPTSE